MLENVRRVNSWSFFKCFSNASPRKYLDNIFPFNSKIRTFGNFFSNLKLIRMKHHKFFLSLLDWNWEKFVLAAKADPMHNSMFNILELHLGKKYDCSLSTSSDLDKDKSCKSFRVYAVLSCCCSVLPHSGVKKLDKY